MANQNFISAGRFGAGEACANLDILYGPYSASGGQTALQVAEAEILRVYEQKVKGLTVGIVQNDGSIKEYWYQPNQSNVLELVEKQSASVVVDTTPTEGSNNPVSSGGVYTALEGKANTSDIPAISTNIETDATSETKAAAPKAVKTYVDSKVSSAYKAAGSVANVASLPTLIASNIGKVCNMTSEFTTTSDFVEGSGKTYPAGTNVAVVEHTTGVYKYDVMSGFVDLSGKADKSEMSVTDGTGANADKTTIQLKNGTSATVLKQHQSLAGYVQRSGNYTENNFASFDAIGGIQDSGFSDGNFIKGVKQNGDPIMPDANGVVDVTVQDGEDGLSAFEIAQQQGYTGTVDQWLASLKANIGAFKFITPTDTTAEAALTAIGDIYASAIGGVSPTQSTLSIILLMNDSNNTKTMMIATQETTTSGVYEFVYAGDLQSAMPGNVATTDDLNNYATKEFSLNYNVFSVNNKGLQKTGDIVNAEGYYVTPLIPIGEYDMVYTGGYSTGDTGNYSLLCTYDKKGNFINHYGDVGSSGSKEILFINRHTPSTPEQGATYLGENDEPAAFIRIGTRNAVIADSYLKIRPYFNYYKETSFGVNGVVMNAATLQKKMVQDSYQKFFKNYGYIDSNGIQQNNVASSSYRCTDLLEITSFPIIIRGCNAGNTRICALYDESKQFIGVISADTLTSSDIEIVIDEDDTKVEVGGVIKTAKYFRSTASSLFLSNAYVLFGLEYYLYNRVNDIDIDAINASIESINSSIADINGQLAPIQSRLDTFYNKYTFNKTNTKAELTNPIVLSQNGDYIEFKVDSIGNIDEQTNEMYSFSHGATNSSVAIGISSNKLYIRSSDTGSPWILLNQTVNGDVSGKNIKISYESNTIKVYVGDETFTYSGTGQPSLTIGGFGWINWNTNTPKYWEGSIENIIVNGAKYNLQSQSQPSSYSLITQTFGTFLSESEQESLNSTTPDMMVEKSVNEVDVYIKSSDGSYVGIPFKHRQIAWSENTYPAFLDNWGIDVLKEYQYSNGAMAAAHTLFQSGEAEMAIQVPKGTDATVMNYVGGAAHGFENIDSVDGVRQVLLLLNGQQIGETDVVSLKAADKFEVFEKSSIYQAYTNTNPWGEVSKHWLITRDGVTITSSVKILRTIDIGAAQFGMLCVLRHLDGNASESYLTSRAVRDNKQYTIFEIEDGWWNDSTLQIGKADHDCKKISLWGECNYGFSMEIQTETLQTHGGMFIGTNNGQSYNKVYFDMVGGYIADWYYHAQPNDVLSATQKWYFNKNK